MKRIILVVIACVLMMAGVGMVSAMETIVDETISLDMDYYWSSSTLYYVGDVLEVTIKTDGAPVDIFLMNAHDFDEYEDMQNDQSGADGFNYYVDGSALKVVKKRYAFEIPETNTYYIVVDNTIQPEGGADPRRSVNAHVAITGEEAPGFGAILAFVGLLTAMMHISRRRK